MQPLDKRIVSCLLLALISAGCTDKDRELARRTGDGSDTFKYTPPRDTTRPPPEAGEKNPPAKDGSDTFRYKRDPRTFPKSEQPQGK